MLLIFDGVLSRGEAILLIVSGAAYLFYTLFYKPDLAEHSRGLVPMIRSIFSAKNDKKSVRSVQGIGAKTWFQLIGSVIGLAILSKVAIDSMLAIVVSVGVGVEAISFFALAVGTSLPEFVVSIKALKKGQGDIVLGNIIGSCMFNVSIVAGFAGLITPQTVSLPAGYGMFAGIVGAVLLLALSSSTKRIHVWEGVTFIMLYAALTYELLIGSM